MGSADESGSLFVNDGSFLERFKQLQEQHEAAKLAFSPAAADGQGQEPTSTSGSSPQDGNSVKSSPANRQQGSSFVSKAGQKAPVATNGKLAFSLKQKSRLAVNALKLGGEDDDDGEDGQGDSDRRSKKQKSDRASGFSGPQSEQGVYDLRSNSYVRSFRMSVKSRIFPRRCFQLWNLACKH